MIASPAFWFISVPVALALAAASVWLYRHINLANSEKKWFRLLFNGVEWKPILEAIDHLREVEEFRER